MEKRETIKNSPRISLSKVYYPIWKCEFPPICFFILKTKYFFRLQRLILPLNFYIGLIILPHITLYRTYNTPTKVLQRTFLFYYPSILGIFKLAISTISLPKSMHIFKFFCVSSSSHSLFLHIKMTCGLDSTSTLNFLPSHYLSKLLSSISHLHKGTDYALALVIEEQQVAKSNDHQFLSYSNCQEHASKFKFICFFFQHKSLGDTKLFCIFSCFSLCSFYAFPIQCPLC